MADVRPFRALRYDSSHADPAETIAPPYDVISAADQRALYDRSEYNIVRVEYGSERPNDSDSDNRYTRAARDLRAWRDRAVLLRDARPAVYAYSQQFEWSGAQHVRTAYFAVARLEEWEKGIIKPHEHTLAKPKADRLNLLRATRTQVSPVYSIFRAHGATPTATLPARGEPLYEFEADGQRHTLSALSGEGDLATFTQAIANSDVYIADGHHRYETALAYRDEMRKRAGSWTGDEPENFVLMAFTHVHDPGLLVLPTHRLISAPGFTVAQLEQLAPVFDVTAPIGSTDDGAPLNAALQSLQQEHVPAFLAITAESARCLRLRNRAVVEARMPPDQPGAWKRLDVNVLQYGVLQPLFGIDDAVLTAGGRVTYTQDAGEAQNAVRSGSAEVAFLVNATTVEQVLAVADAAGRMPQKSTFFYPKLPTGLVMNVLEP